MERQDFATEMQKIGNITNNDVQLASETLIARHAIDVELLRSQLTALTAYAKELYDENIFLKATQAPQDIDERGACHGRKNIVSKGVRRSRRRKRTPNKN